MEKSIKLESVILNTADVVLFGNGNIISKVIKFFTYGRDDNPGEQVHHSGTISRGGKITNDPNGAEIVESWARVIETAFSSRGFYPGVRIEVWRNRTMLTEQKKEIGTFLKANRGRFYGFKYIPFYGLDLLLSKLANRRVFYFRSKIRDRNRVICSVLTILGYFERGYTFGLDSPYYATPEYLQSWMKANPDEWELVYIIRKVKENGRTSLRAYTP